MNFSVTSSVTNSPKVNLQKLFNQQSVIIGIMISHQYHISNKWKIMAKSSNNKNKNHQNNNENYGNSGISSAVSQVINDVR